MQRRTIFILVSSLFVFLSCFPYEDEEIRSNYQPILMTRDQLEKSVLSQPPRDFIQTGKIYTKGSYIFINEKYRGIHVINNQDPANPQKVSFISIPGSIDIAVKGNSLYADNAIDLVALDISDVNNIVITGRQKEIFPELLPPDNDRMPTKYEAAKRPENTIIIGWEKAID
jgi:hypothetical protein